MFFKKQENIFSHYVVLWLSWISKFRNSILENVPLPIRTFMGALLLIISKAKLMKEAIISVHVNRVIIGY